ncbi:cytochrome b N-terminal domain-containing protein [Streptomyces sp. ActVer]|uniref:cytochrome b N-terminal domain-containing protein n=1 Tax=Streptomyces sp. ActVer TaxID=3014558 RepID=UPI0022B3BDA8|nr:cytochrome b N-terminal domain-containing protein [Streptomyces sp. ActVer]MCZ4508737.1 cytochrome b N-terminal domain-containing protein [Streptomyces sp. ActVer]
MTADQTSPSGGKSAGPAHRGRLHRAVDAIDERMGIKALTYPVPEHANNLGWSLGGITAVAFVILLVTGIYITQFYTPIPEDANESVRDLVTDVWLGGFARALHYWAAQAMFVFALLHLLRVFFHASYKKPREGNWVVGAAMFLLTFLAVFTGTVLKWDQEGYEALIHNLDVAELLGGAGIWFTSELTDRVPILLRLYSAHVVIIPGLVLLLFVWHALLVKRHKISTHPEIPVPEVETPEPFTAHLKRVAAFGLVLLGVLSVLGVLVPPVVGPTPVEGIEVTRPLWMFWWFFPMEEWFGVASIAYVIAGVFGLIFLVPFLDRSPKRRWRERKLALGAAVVLLLALVAITVQVWIANPKGH